MKNFVSPLCFDISRRDIDDLWIDLCDDDTFRSELSSAFRSTTSGPVNFYHNWRDVLYILTRIIRPARVVETGVRGGLSSAYILNALNREDCGHLVSIDIGDMSILPDDVDNPEIGWIVPERLRSRWDLRIADSSSELPLVLDENTDLFISDVPNKLLREELWTAAKQMLSGSVVITCSPQSSMAETIWREFADGALKATSKATRWESEEGRSILRAGVLATDVDVPADA